MFSEAMYLTIAQVAITLTGFSGVVAVLGKRGGGAWTAEEKLQLRTLVEPSLVALFGSLIPGTLRQIHLSEGVMWRLSCLLLFSLISAALLAFMIRMKQSKTTIGQRILTLLSVIVVASLLGAALNLVPNKELVFLLGLWLGLIVAIYNFTLLLFTASDGQ